MNIKIAYILALISILTMVLFFYAIRTIEHYDHNISNTRDDKIIGKKSTYFLDNTETDKQCEICFGRVNDEPILECSCGRFFHVSCAKLTKECPYCKGPYSDMRDRAATIIRCPSCGKLVIDNICTCGTVLPNKDNSFKCICGSQMDTSKTECPKCGAEYRSEIGIARKTV
jgi:hypothetical protein